MINPLKILQRLQLKFTVTFYFLSKDQAHLGERDVHTPDPNWWYLADLMGGLPRLDMQQDILL